jgi:hypothetical protein
VILTYILDQEHRLVRCDDTRVWTEWMAVPERRRVALDHVTAQIYVSTIFLGLDHNFFDLLAPPILFETMVFGGAMNLFQERYCTWDDAELGHNTILAEVIAVEELERMSK